MTKRTRTTETTVAQTTVETPVVQDTKTETPAPKKLTQAQTIARCATAILNLDSTLRETPVVNRRTAPKDLRAAVVRAIESFVVLGVSGSDPTITPVAQTIGAQWGSLTGDVKQRGNSELAYTLERAVIARMETVRDGLTQWDGSPVAQTTENPS